VTPGRTIHDCDVTVLYHKSQFFTCRELLVGLGAISPSFRWGVWWAYHFIPDKPFPDYTLALILNPSLESVQDPVCRGCNALPFGDKEVEIP